MAGQKHLSFEKALEKLEQIVKELEQDDLALETALKKFEEGVKLSKRCHQQLESTERKVRLLLESEDGTIQEVEHDQIQKDQG